MYAQVKAWGNGQGIRFSKEFLESLGIQINDYLNLEVVDGAIVLSKTFKHKTLEERTEEFNGKIGPYQENPWSGEPIGREKW